MPHTPAALKDELESLGFWAEAFRDHTRLHGDPRMAALANRFAGARAEAAAVCLRFSSRSAVVAAPAGPSRQSWGLNLLRRSRASGMTQAA